MNKFYWIPSAGKPKLIESEDSVNKVWHDLMNDPDHHLCFETVHSCIAYNILLIVDDSGKLKPHFVNKFASLFYYGTPYGDYIAGDVLIGKLVNVPYIEDNELLFYEKDIGSLSEHDINLIQNLLNNFNG